MDILHDALRMLETHPLCDHCLGRQFAMLGHGIENDGRGKALKLTLTLTAHALLLSENKEGVEILKILATNGFSKVAHEILRKNRKRIAKRDFPQTCFLCEDKFTSVDHLTKNILKILESYEYHNFLVGVQLPLLVEEREDEFRANLEVHHSESMRNEFGRLFGKKIAEDNGKPVEFMKPEVVVLVNPFSEAVKLQINPLFVGGRYKKLVRGIPQSKWFCTNCRGKGCKKCDWTGKMYSESVEEIIGKPFLEATSGLKSSFHASGREDIDARMLGTGRPFVIEITNPKKRFLELDELKKRVNVFGRAKVQVSNLWFANKQAVRELKKGEATQKEYFVTIEFENEIKSRDLQPLKERLTNTTINQRTPLRVLHRRADLTREKYIYNVDVKKLSPKKAEMKIRCQGGLYVKELVTGDEGRTTPNVSEILKNRAKPIKLDVLKVIMGD